MKKVFTLILALALGFGLKAQCPLTTAVDFTATDVHGTEVHLFDILDGGQAVLIDFFFTTCGPCQQATPKIVESYYAMGCNMHDVFYMEIATGDSDAACLNWVNTYGVEYPTISGQAGGTQICNQYSIGAYPTVILIMPDRSIVINDLWPINNAQTVIAALEQHGLEQHDCNTPSYDPQVSITIDQIQGTEVTATFTPNEDCVAYGYMMATEAEIQEWMGIAGLDLPEYLWTYGIPGSGEMSNTFTDLTPDTEYVIYAVPADIDGNLGEVVQVPVTTTPSGPTYDIIPDFTGTDIDGNEIHLYDILDAGQHVLIHFFLVDDTYDFMP
ncbi:MAG: redoxin domain-containing protein, partial [Bacteroidales bacterium]|nr:redoxin domain-containing protein [Bacteroidales bacterium]